MITLSNIDFAITPSGNGKASWVRLLNAGSEVHDGKRMRAITLEYMVQVAQEWRKANYSFEQIAKREGTKPYRFPVKVNHAKDGKRYGDIIDMKVQNEALYAKAAWNDDVWESIQANAYQHVSVGIWPEYINQDGDKFGPIVTEFSLTEYPRVQGIGTIQDSLTMELAMQDQNVEEEIVENALEPEEAPEEANEDIQEELMEALYKRLYSALKEDLMAALMPPQEEEEAPQEEEVVEASHVAPQDDPLLLAIESLREEVRALSNPKRTKLPTMELGHEGAPNVVTPSMEDRVNALMKQGLTVEKAVLTAMKG